MIKVLDTLTMKLIRHLSGKEGYMVETTEYIEDGTKSILKDVFGFRFEVQIKLIGRISDAQSDYIPEKAVTNVTHENSLGKYRI